MRPVRALVKDELLVVGVPWSVHELGPAVQAAHAFGLSIVVADTVERLRMVPPGIAIEQMPLAALNSDTLVAALGARRPPGIVSLTELSMECAAEVREALGYRGTPSAVERSVAEKPLTRDILSKHGLTSVRWWECTLSNIADIVSSINFPVVLKPRALTGSAGVRFLASAQDLKTLGRQYRDHAKAFCRDQVTLEAFVPGTEVSVEGLVVNGHFILFAVTDKLNTGVPYFFELGHVLPSRYSSERSREIEQYLQRCITAIGVVTSPIHAELKIADGVLEVIELHTRYGGDNIVRLLELAGIASPFHAYFAAVLNGTVPAPHLPTACWGIGFYTAVVGRRVECRSFAFPYPYCVQEIDFDARRTPKLEEYEGVRLVYWRAGHMYCGSSVYEHVYGNVAFLASECNLDHVVPEYAG